MTARWVTCKGGSEKSKVGIGGDSGGGTISSSVAHDVSGLAFEVCDPACITSICCGLKMKLN